MISIVVTEVTQFAILTVSSLAIGAVAITQVSPAMIEGHIPPGWLSPFFGWHLGVDWSGISTSS